MSAAREPWDVATRELSPGRWEATLARDGGPTLLSARAATEREALEGLQRELTRYRALLESGA